MIKYYNKPLQQVYSIIITEISGMELKLILQMFFKTINNLMNPNKLVLTLLIFGAYFRITKQDALFLSII